MFVDSGADIEPLVAAVERWGRDARRDPAHALAPRPRRARGRAARRYGLEVVAEPGEWEWGGLQVRGARDARATPTTWSRSSSATTLVFTGDTLFKDAVGGGDLEQVRRRR